MEYLDQLLERLTRADGIGYAGTANETVCAELRSHGIEARIEKDGSVLGYITRPGGVGVMLACHLDEVGFMVSSIDDQGRIRCSAVGGVDPRILPGQEVMILGRKRLYGYIGAKPPHLLNPEERNKVLSLQKLFIDTGLNANKVKKYVRIGDVVSFLDQYRKLPGQLRSAKSLDNRAGVACGIMVLKELKRLEHNCDLYFIATSQEEYTGLGAKVQSYKLPIKYAIVVDVTFAEHPDLKDHEYLPLDSGPAIGRGATIPENLFRRLTATAQANEIPFQVEALPTGTGTDADTIAFNREGIPTCVIGIPLRYMHTPVEIVSLKDIDRTARLIIEFLKTM
jgi:putative aminopeptidase FrvX